MVKCCLLTCFEFSQSLPDYSVRWRYRLGRPIACCAQSAQAPSRRRSQPDLRRPPGANQNEVLAGANAKYAAKSAGDRLLCPLAELSRRETATDGREQYGLRTDRQWPIEFVRAHDARDPLQAPAEAEQFTRQLHKAIVDDPSGLGPAVATASKSLDLGERTARSFAKVSSPEQALEVVKKALEEARIAHARALAPLK